MTDLVTLSRKLACDEAVRRNQFPPKGEKTDRQRQVLEMRTLSLQDEIGYYPVHFRVKAGIKKGLKNER